MKGEADPETYLTEVLHRSRAVLGPDLVGAYVIGSLATGDYVAGRSDIDVAIVTAGTSERSLLELLVARLAHPALACPAPKLELVAYPRSAVQGERPTLEWVLNLNTGPEVGLRASFDPAGEPGHWFLLDVAMAREQARALTGPPPSDLFGRVERSRVVAALLESIRWHEEHDARGVQTVLNAARALRFAREGRWSSKSQAAAWVRVHGPDPGLAAAALAGRRAGHQQPLDRGRVLAFLSAVRRSLEAAGAAGGER